MLRPQWHPDRLCHHLLHLGRGATHGGEHLAATYPHWPPARDHLRYPRGGKDIGRCRPSLKHHLCDHCCRRLARAPHHLHTLHWGILCHQWIKCNRNGSEKVLRADMVLHRAAGGWRDRHSDHHCCGGMCPLLPLQLKIWKVVQ